MAGGLNHSYRDGPRLVPSVVVCPAILQARRTDPLGRHSLPSPRRATFHVKTAALSDRRSLRLHSIVLRAPSQGPRNLVGLVESEAFAAPRPVQPFVTTDFHTPSKAHENHVAHVVRIPSRRRSAGRVAVAAAVEEQL